jgi:cardiolipin synthase A/B
MSSRSVVILPDDSSKPILDAIAGAKKSLRIKMFVFSDPDLLKAVIDAKGRGLDVQVMLNPARRNGDDDNAESRKTLQAAGIEVKDSNPEFGLTHEKSMVLDGESAFIKSLNWVTENLNETRDYAIITNHPAEAREILDCFEADWNRKVFEPPADSHLIWCCCNGRERVAHFIDNVKHTLFVQNERYQDAVIIERLVRAAVRGVKVHVMARPPHTLKKDKLIEGVGGLRIMSDVGIKIHKLKKLRLHGKMLLADHDRAIVGSINLAPGSFDDRRELAIEVHDEEVVKRLRQVAEQDWENSKALDLSDEGLMADLAKREGTKAGASGLVLDVDDDEHHRSDEKKHHKDKK